MSDEELENDEHLAMVAEDLQHEVRWENAHFESRRAKRQLLFLLHRRDPEAFKENNWSLQTPKFELEYELSSREHRWEVQRILDQDPLAAKLYVAMARRLLPSLSERQAEEMWVDCHLRDQPRPSDDFWHLLWLSIVSALGSKEVEAKDKDGPSAAECPGAASHNRDSVDNVRPAERETRSDDSPATATTAVPEANQG